MCENCQEPINQEHKFLLTETGVIHLKCEEPEIGGHEILKDGPKFETATPNERQISQHEIYKKS